MRKLLYLLLIMLPLSCTSGGNALEKVLAPEELDLAKRITNEIYIDIHNKVAMEGCTEAPQIIDRYFENGLRISETLGSMETLVPDCGYVSVLLDIFDKDVLARFVDYDPISRRLAIKKDGKYMEVLEKMSRRNGFFKGFYKFMQESDGCNGLPYIIAINYKNIDFEKEDEQFIAYLALLTRPDNGAVKFGK